MSRGGYPRSHVQRGVSTHPWTYLPLPLCAIHPFLSRIPTPLGYPPQEYPLLDIPILPDILTPWTYPPQLVTLVVITGDILTPTPTPLSTMTDTCENITFPQLRRLVVNIGTQDVFMPSKRTKQWRNEHTIQWQQQLNTWKRLRWNYIYLLFNTDLKVHSFPCNVDNLPTMDDLSRSKYEIIESNEGPLLFPKRMGNSEWKILVNTTEKMR